MRRCLELAEKGRGKTAPNPMVGSVVVHKGRIIGEGYHEGYGLPHAEVNAIASVKDEGMLRDSILYVNLEPCSHFGKTPPCSALILEKGIPEVVIGAGDPNPVSSGGMAVLESKGVRVSSGILEEKCLELNRRFYTFQRERRPWILLKWAQSADGYMDIHRQPGDDPGVNWITGRQARQLVHRWRAEEMAVLVGTRTAKLDNPELTVRDWNGRNPLRLVIDRAGILDPGSKLFNDAADTVVFTSETADLKARKDSPHSRVRYVAVPEGADYPEAISDYLVSEGCISLMVEGGAGLLGSFIGRGLWDEARVFTGTKNFGAGVKAPDVPGLAFSIEMIDQDSLEVYRNLS